MRNLLRKPLHQRLLAGCARALRCHGTPSSADAFNLRIGALRAPVLYMVGLPGFEPGSRDPQPRSIGQANLQALWASLTRRGVVKALSDSQSSLAILKGAISSTRSTCPTNILLQQYLSMPRSSSALSESLPVSIASLYCSYTWAITFPQLQHLTGINI